MPKRGDKWGHGTRTEKRKARTSRVRSGAATAEDLLPAAVAETKLAALAASPSPGAVSRYLLERGAQEWCDNLIRDLRPGSGGGRYRTAMNLFPRAARILGVGDELLEQLLSRYGLASEDELERTAEQRRRASAMSPQERANLNVKALRLHLAQHPDQYDSIVQQLRPIGAIEPPRQEVES